jgi:hypothetical protein
MWVVPAKRACYGKLFPDVTRLELDQQHAGAVFGCRRNSFGNGEPAVAITVDEANWERCVDCPHYRSCYDLSMAKLLFAQVVGAQTSVLRTRENAAP